MGLIVSSQAQPPRFAGTGKQYPMRCSPTSHPLKWEHINLTGDYHTGARTQGSETASYVPSEPTLPLTSGTPRAIFNQWRSDPITIAPELCTGSA